MHTIPSPSISDPEGPSNDPAGTGPGASPGGAIPRERLEDEIRSLAQRLSAGTYELLVLIGRYDASGAWAATGALSCAAWLADVCDVASCTARSQVRVARAMRAHRLLAQAMASGDVSYSKARVLAPHLSTDNAQALVDLACTNTADRLGAAIAAWANRHEDPEVIARRQHESRRVSWRTEPDGTVTITAKLPPAAAGTVIAVIDHHVTTNTAPAGASLAQQRADAFTNVVTSGGGSVAAEIVVHVRPDGCALADGTPLADHTVASLLPEAFVSLLIKDMAGHPIDASPRRRFPTRRQRRVADEAHPTCAQPGCDARTLLQYDHISPYAAGGPTTVANLQRLCGPHNRAKSA